jgi:hypothetical protein
VNQSESEAALNAAAVRLRDRQGHELRSAATFIPGYAHNLFPFSRDPRVPQEEARLGRTAQLASGQTTRFTVSWPGSVGGRAHEIDLGTTTLPVPD